VTAEVRRYLDGVRTLAATAGSYDQPTLPKFRHASDPLMQADLPGVASISYLITVPAGQVAVTQRLWREHGATGLTLHPQGGGPEHIFAVLVRSADDRTVTGLGRDVTVTSPVLLAALRRAEAAGQPAVSDTFRLFKDRTLPVAEQQLSFVFAAAVWSVPDAAGRRVLRGWVTMALRGRDFVGTALGQATREGLAAGLLATDGNGRQVQVVGSGAAPAAGDLQASRVIQIADRQWTLQTSAAAGQLAGGAGGVLASGVAGVLISLLLGGLVLVLATGRERAEHEVELATAELRRA
jgi:hypothetical protein